MATLATSGFRTNVLPQWTPIDPRDAVRDPFAFSTGVQRGMADMRALEEDAILRGDRPRQQLLKDIELAQAQAELANTPRANRLKDLQLADAERRFRIGLIEPVEQGKPVREIDASGNLIEYQPTLDFNPTTGRPYDIGTKPAMDTSLIKTAQQLDSERRAMEALAQNRTLTGEARMISAQKPAGAGKYTIKEYPDERNQQIIRVTLDPQGKEVSRTIVLGPDNKPVPPKPTINPLTGKPVFEVRTTEVDGPESEIFGSSSPAPAAPAQITGTQAPANAVPEIRLKKYFSSEAEANAALAAGQIAPGEEILINGRLAVIE